MSVRTGIIIVSNRLPVSVKKTDGKLSFYPSVGGLATGLASYVTNKRNQWIGWPGIANEEITEKERLTIADQLAKHNCYPVFLSKNQIENYYNGYSNRIIWPLFHELPLDVSPEDQQRYWAAYSKVNVKFVETILARSDPGSTIWVHDYHLLLLPELLRSQRPADNIGFFLHIPFPSQSKLSVLAHYKSLLSGMLGAGLVGFHTDNYVENFLENCRKLRDCLVSDGQVILNDRVIRVTDFPMGIDYAKFAEAAKLQSVRRELRKLKLKYLGRKVILTVDRLDPTKGLVERLLAYEQFLATNPKFYKKVVMVMVAVPSRTEIDEYKRLKRRVENLVQKINRQFGTKLWQPVDYRYESLPFESIAALYQMADVAFIVPLRDGMNLVAKEFIASKRHQNGVLILSETAGAAQELREALLVNPKHKKSLVGALTQAITMPKKELQARLTVMQNQIEEFNVNKWAQSFMHTLTEPRTVKHFLTHSLNESDIKRLANQFQAAKRQLLLLDYDGVLVPFENNPLKAYPSDSLKQLLTQLAKKDGLEVVVISGRSQHDLENWLAGVPVSLVAEHGAVVRQAGDKKWQKISQTTFNWKKDLLAIFEKYVARTPGSTVEVKEWSIVWHYRQAQPYYAQKNLVILKRLLKPVAKTKGLIVQNGSKILEVRPADITKGMALNRWLQSKPDFIVAIGDDVTDEDMFLAVPAGSFTIKVGRGQTNAKLRLKSNKQVLGLLKKFAG